MLEEPLHQNIAACLATLVYVNAIVGACDPTFGYLPQTRALCRRRLVSLLALFSRLGDGIAPLAGKQFPDGFYRTFGQ
jgi:hypothetical protein